MLRRAAILLMMSLALALAACAQVATSPPALPGSSGDHAELQGIKMADQQDRKPGANIDWSVIGQRDRERLKRVRELVTAAS